MSRRTRLAARSRLLGGRLDGMDRLGARAYVARPWAALQREKRRYWSGAARTPAERIAIAEGLREHARSLHPDWPTGRDRAEDLAHHIELKRLLSAVK